MKKTPLVILTIFLCIVSEGHLSNRLTAATMISLEKITDNVTNPVHITHAGDGSNRLFIIEQAGRVIILNGKEQTDTPFLDIQSKVDSGGEKGLLSIAFHPDFKNNGRFFVNYTMSRKGLKTVIAEYHVSDVNPDIADTDEKIIFEVEQPFGNHNGGQLQFGPDGFLYIGMGDGGGSGDPSGNGQNINTLLGALLRIDINNGSSFSIPQDNPFVEKDGADEIWAYGLRNPWRFSFDRFDGRLFLADVGQDDFEEIDLIVKGGNYGWNIMEGLHCFPPIKKDCDQDGLVLPIAEYSHDEGQSVTGGYVYRGKEISDLAGSYIFGDFVSSIIWSIKETAPNIWERTKLLETDLAISSFGEDEQGEIYIADHRGAIHKIIPISSEDSTPALTPTPTPKTFTFSCNRNFTKIFNGIEKLELLLGQSESCLLKLIQTNPDKPLEISTNIRSGLKSSIAVNPSRGITNDNGELEFTINAINSGIDWIAWASPNEKGEFVFNKDAYDNGSAWGMFVEVK